MKYIKMWLLIAVVFTLALAGCARESKDAGSSGSVQGSDIYEVEVFKDFGGGMVHGIAFDDSGHMFIGREGKVFRITPDGGITEFADMGKLPEDADKAGLDNMTVDRDGNLYIAGGDRIVKVAGDGRITTAVIVKKEAYDREREAGVNDVKLNPRGEIYAVHTANTLTRFSARMERNDIITADDPGLYSIYGMIGFDFNRDCSKIYITGMGSNSLGIFPLDGKGAIDIAKAIYAKNIPRAHYVAVDEYGNAFVTAENMLVKVDENGNTDIPKLSGEFKDPNTVAFGRRGFDEKSLYITTFDGKILKVNVGVKAARDM